jgi:hypothetical protein
MKAEEKEMRRGLIIRFDGLEGDVCHAIRHPLAGAPAASVTYNLSRQNNRPAQFQ